jgi:two-component system cell cycle sensor histidine kinase/response regulator CckA
MEIVGRLPCGFAHDFNNLLTVITPSTSGGSRAIDLSARAPRLAAGDARVLVVEDDPGVRQIVEIVLRRGGYDVVAVEGPLEAIAVMNARSDINIVLTDVVMPRMNGYDLATEVKTIAPHARVVFMSGYAQDAIRQPVTDAFLAKPFTAESLTHVIRNAMALAR